MTDQTGVALAHALKVNGVLTKVRLNLKEHEDGDRAAEAFSEALNENTTLQTLLLQGPLFPNQDSLDLFEQALQRNRGLPSQWIAVASLAHYATRKRLTAMPEQDFRRAIFSFFLPDGIARRMRAKAATRRAADGATTVRPAKEAGECQRDNMGSVKEDEAIQHVDHAEAPTAIDDTKEHADQPTTIDQREAAQFSAEQHVGFIERNLGTMVDKPTVYTDDGLQEGLLMCKINRNSKQLRSELMEGPSLQRCRDALAANGNLWKDLSGALIFTHPLQYRMALVGLKHTQLQADHIVFAESLEYLVEEAMSRCKSAWMKIRVAISGSSSEIATFGGGEEIESVSGGSTSSEQLDWSEYAEIVVQRTFITLVLRHAAESEATKSTTDAHLHSTANPRHSKSAW